MRVLVLDTYYPALLERHYSSRPELADAPYAEQLQALMSLGFGTTDAYSRCLIEAGVPAADAVVNCPQLQSAWARENGISSRLGGLRLGSGRLARAASARAATRIVAAQIEAFEPDVLYLQALNALPRGELRRQRAKGRLVVGQIASALPDPGVVKAFDLILTSFPHFVERIRALGVRSEYFPIAFDAAVIARLRSAGVNPSPDADRPHEVTFVGGVDPRVHGEGTNFLARLIERVPLDIWGYGADQLPADSPILGRHHGEAWGMDMYRVLAESKIAINRHIDAAEGFSNNMRLFEATGVGALLFTEESPNLAELFEPDREVVTYRDSEELAAKISHYLADEDDRRRIAAAGQARTMEEHTYQRRIPQLAEILEANV